MSISFFNFPPFTTLMISFTMSLLRTFSIKSSAARFTVKTLVLTLVLSLCLSFSCWSTGLIGSLGRSLSWGLQNVRNHGKLFFQRVKLKFNSYFLLIEYRYTWYMPTIILIFFYANSPLLRLSGLAMFIRTIRVLGIVDIW